MFTRPPVVVSNFSDISEFTKVESLTTGTSTMDSASAAGGKGVYVGGDSLRLLLTGATTNDYVQARFDCNVPANRNERFAVRLYQDVIRTSQPNDENWALKWFVGNTAGDYTNGVRTPAIQNVERKRRFEMFICTQAEFTSSLGTGIDWDQPIRSMYLQLQKLTDDGDANMYFDEMYAGWEMDRIPVVFSWDDGVEPTAGDEFGPAWLTNEFDERNWNLTLALNSNVIDTGGKLTSEECASIRSRGHTIVYHGHDHSDHRLTGEGGDFADAAAMKADLETYKAWAATVGADSRVEQEWFVPPFGRFTETMLGVCEDVGIRYIRRTTGIEGTANSGATLWFRNDAFTAGYLQGINHRSLGQTEGSSDVTDWVLTCIEQQAAACFFGHYFADTPDTANEFDKQSMEAVINWLFARQYTLDQVRVGALTELPMMMGASSARHTRARRSGGRRTLT